VDSQASTRSTRVRDGFFVVSGRNSGEIEGEFDTYLKKQSQMPAFGWKSEARSLESEITTFCKAHLKKQTQFSKGEMGVTSIMTKDYENKTALWPRRNKANSKPIRPNTANEFDRMPETIRQTRSKKGARDGAS
jgi:hypothetical protein